MFATKIRDIKDLLREASLRKIKAHNRISTKNNVSVVLIKVTHYNRFITHKPVSRYSGVNNR